MGELKLHHDLHPVAVTSYGRAFERRGKQDVGKSRLTKSNFWLHNLTVTSYQLRKSVMLLQKFKAPSNAPAAYPSSNLSMLLADFIHYLLARNLSIYDFASVYFKSKVERIAMLF